MRAAEIIKTELEPLFDVPEPSGGGAPPSRQPPARPLPTDHQHIAVKLGRPGHFAGVASGRELPSIVCYLQTNMLITNIGDAKLATARSAPSWDPAAVLTSIGLVDVCSKGRKTWEKSRIYKGAEFNRSKWGAGFFALWPMPAHP